MEQVIDHHSRQLNCANSAAVAAELQSQSHSTLLLKVWLAPPWWCDLDGREEIISRATIQSVAAGKEGRIHGAWI